MLRAQGDRGRRWGCAAQLRAARGEDGHAGENVVLGLLHVGGELGPAAARPHLDVAPGIAGRGAVGLTEGRSNCGGHDSILAARDVGHGVSHPVDTTALPVWPPPIPRTGSGPHHRRSARLLPCGRYARRYLELTTLPSTVRRSGYPRLGLGGSMSGFELCWCLWPIPGPDACVMGAPAERTTRNTMRFTMRFTTRNTMRFTTRPHLPLVPGHRKGPHTQERSGPRGPAGPVAVRDTIASAIATSPARLRRSSCRDRGAGMTRHADLRIGRGAPVRFRDPRRRLSADCPAIACRAMQGEAARTGPPVACGAGTSPGAPAPSLSRRTRSRRRRPTAGRAGPPAGAPAAMPHDPPPTARNAAATAGRDGPARRGGCGERAPCP